MPQQQNLTIADGQPTPVNRTFTAMTPGSEGSFAKWRYKKTGFPYADPVIRYRARPSNGPDSRPAQKVDYQVKVPYSTNDTTTQTAVVHNAFEFNGSFTWPDNFPEANRADAIAFVINSLSALKDGIASGESYT